MVSNQMVSTHSLRSLSPSILRTLNNAMHNTNSLRSNPLNPKILRILIQTERPTPERRGSLWNKKEPMSESTEPKARNSEVIISPNPNTGHFNLMFTGESYNVTKEVQVIAIDGRIVHQVTIPKKTYRYSFDLKHLSSGIYMVKEQNNLFLPQKMIIH